jgi:superfamily I DNA/RNA helicase
MHSRTPLSPDDDQRRVVEHGAGPLCVLGGPGTGKTTMLEERFIRLATTPGLGPDRILLLVPTRGQKIAVQNRLTQALLFGAGVEALIEVPVYTWHGLAYHLVSRHYDRLAYAEPPVLLTSPEQWAATREALAEENPANWPHHRHLLGNRGFVDEMVDFIIRVEQRLLEDPDLDRLVEHRPAWADLVRFYRHHREGLRARSRVDYPTLLRDAAELIANHDDVREALLDRFIHVLVDDGQELSFVQQRLLSFLTGAGENDGHSLVVAADPDSAIEHFRGADPSWLERFAEEFGGSGPVTLSTSYRLGEDLGTRALKLVAVDGAEAHRPAVFAGDTIAEVRRYPSLSDEADGVARDLRLAHLVDGVAYENMAILLTSPRAMLPALERALQAVEVPYAVSAPDRPLEREGVVHTFCELARCSYSDEPEHDRLVEVLRSPLVGLEFQEVRELERAALAARIALVNHLEAVRSRDDRIEHFLDLRAALRRNRDAPADEAFWQVWQRSHSYGRLVEAARLDITHPANRDVDALVAFAHALGRFVERRRGRGTLEEYLDAITRADFGSDPWLPPERARAHAVQVLSFHAAKGREWDLVAVSGVIEGAIPKGARAQGLFDPYFLDAPSADDRVVRNEAEDRRVLYVALTRARRRCLVTTSPGPSRKGQPSRFLAELVDEVPEVEPPAERPPLTFSEAAARARRGLSDTTAPVSERLASLATIARICEVDPTCTAAQPAEWWWRWDWTEGAVPINEQSYREEDMAPDKLRTSYSRISHYDNCPLQYLAQTVLGLDPDVTHHLHFGRWIHEIIEDCEKDPTEEHRRLGRRRLTNEDMVFQRYEEVFDDSVFPNAAIARQVKADGRVMLANYIKYLRPGSAALVEHEFRLDVDGHAIKGRIDRVDAIGRNLKVSDYKTSRSEIGWDEARESLQLAIYYKAAREDPAISSLGEPVSMQLVYPFKVARADVSRRCQTPEEAEKVLVRLLPLMEGVLGEHFAPSPEADCRWCRFKPMCPLWAEGKELQP